MTWIIFCLGVFTIGLSVLTKYLQYQLSYYSDLFAKNQENKEYATMAIEFMDYAKIAIYSQYVVYFIWFYILGVVIERILK